MEEEQFPWPPDNRVRAGVLAASLAPGWAELEQGLLHYHGGKCWKDVTVRRGNGNDNW